jgi:hypothetical protein
VFGVDFGIEIDGFIDGGHEISRKGAKAQRKDSDWMTLPVTPGVTPIPTETPPPPLQSAEYVYDGDGNMVKAVVNDVVTYYPGRHYNEEVDNSVSTVKKFYTMGNLS